MNTLKSLAILGVVAFMSACGGGGNSTQSTEAPKEEAKPAEEVEIGRASCRERV